MLTRLIPAGTIFYHGTTYPGFKFPNKIAYFTQNLNVAIQVIDRKLYMDVGNIENAQILIYGAKVDFELVDINQYAQYSNKGDSWDGFLNFMGIDHDISSLDDQDYLERIQQIIYDKLISLGYLGWIIGYESTVPIDYDEITLKDPSKYLKYTGKITDPEDILGPDTYDIYYPPVEE